MICKCGKRLSCINTRERQDHRYRRYECDCGERVSTVELVVELKNSVDALDSLRTKMYEEAKAQVYEQAARDVTNRIYKTVMAGLICEVTE